LERCNIAVFNNDNNATRTKASQLLPLILTPSCMLETRRQALIFPCFLLLWFIVMTRLTSLLFFVKPTQLSLTKCSLQKRANKLAHLYSCSSLCSSIPRISLGALWEKTLVLNHVHIITHIVINLCNAADPVLEISNARTPVTLPRKRIFVRTQSVLGRWNIGTSFLNTSDSNPILSKSQTYLSWNTSNNFQCNFKLLQNFKFSFTSSNGQTRWSATLETDHDL